MRDKAIINWLNGLQMIEVFNARMRQCDNKKLFAKELGISTTYASELANGQKAVSHTIARKLGYKKITIYIPNQ